MTPEEVVARARSVTGKGCRYGLGKGGFDPDRPRPWDDEHLCDCSGFAMWALGLPRHYREVWYDTSRIVSESRKKDGLFRAIELGQVQPGDLIVYGDRRNKDGGVRQGHVGVITAVNGGAPSLAVHCSRGNERHSGDAIQETSIGLWLAGGGSCVRYVGEAA